MPLVTILGREMLLKMFWSWPSFGDVASAVSHDVAARNAIEIFSSRPSFGDFASAAGHDIGGRNEIEMFSSRPSFGDVAGAASHDIGARKAIENFSNRPSFGDVASAASQKIGTRNAIEIFLKSTKLWSCCKCRSSRYRREKCDWIFLRPTKLWKCCECRFSRYWREKCDWNFFEVDRALEMLPVPLVTILAREIKPQSGFLSPLSGIAGAEPFSSGWCRSAWSLQKLPLAWCCGEHTLHHNLSALAAMHMHSMNQPLKGKTFAVAHRHVLSTLRLPWGFWWLCGALALGKFYITLFQVVQFPSNFQHIFFDKFSFWWTKW